jgi:hypothetical protein
MLLSIPRAKSKKTEDKLIVDSIVGDCSRTP